MDPLKYIADFAPETAENIASEERGVRREDPGGDILPFGHISDRRFEILVYLLKKRQQAGKQVTLMMGVSERGRDVTVHNQKGDLEEIDQCKISSDRLSAPEVGRELLKFALYAHLDPALLPKQQVGYEMWAPGDFSEPALDLLTTWPKQWSTLPLEELFSGLKKKYKSFEKLTWDVVKKWVTEEFPYRLRMTKQNGVDISTAIRAVPEIHDLYFITHHVMPAAAVKEEIKGTLHQAGMRLVTDADERHILDRIKLFKPEDRMCYGPFVFGVPRELVETLTKEEFAAFVQAVGSAFSLVPVIMPATGRLATERAKVADQWPHTNPAFSYAVFQFLSIKAALRLEYHAMAKLEPFTEGLEIAAYRGKTNDEIFEILALKI